MRRRRGGSATARSSSPPSTPWSASGPERETPTRSDPRGFLDFMSGAPSAPHEYYGERLSNGEQGVRRSQDDQGQGDRVGRSSLHRSQGLVAASDDGLGRRRR